MHIWGLLRLMARFNRNDRVGVFFLVLTVIKCVKASEVRGALRRQMYEQRDSW